MDDNFFSQFDQQPDQPQPADQSDNFFAQFDQAPPSDPSAAEAFAHGAERSVIPAFGGLAAAGAGAEAGAALGLAGGPAAPFTVPAGAIIGGITGALLGSTALSTAQDFAIKALPENWQEAIGQSEKQQQAEAEKQPTASFLGGLLPYALTMRPGGWGRAALPENATAWQKIAANPLTAHLFGGAVMGGMELGNEVGAGQQPNWTNVGISTGFGIIFNKPTKIGERLTDVGARPVRKALGLPEPANENAPPAAEQPTAPAPVETPTESPEKDWAETILGGKSPTVAQAGDTKVMGPGITEGVFMGGHQQAAEAEMSAQEAARVEKATLNPETVVPEVPAIARRMEPELFGQYDALTAQRDDLTARLAQIGTPADEEIATLSKERDAIEDKLTAEPQSKILNAQMADAQSQLDDAVTRRDNEPESPELEALRQHLAATEAQLHGMSAEVAAAHRRAADAVGGQVIEPPQNAPSPAAEAPNLGAEAPSASPVAEQQAAIVADVTQRLIASGYTAEQASANAQVLGHRYVTRAARLNGALGSPLELYRSQGPEIRAYGRSPLMPTRDEPNLPVTRGTEAPAEQATIGDNQRQDATVARPSELESLDPATIGVDANRFQFKAGSDAEGVSERLQDVAQWDPRLAGTALVWRDETGKNWIADGHQRLGLAKRLAAAGQSGIRLNAFVLDSASGISDAEARVIAAQKNIAEGTGTAVDAAKIMREEQALGIKGLPLPPRSALVRDGKALSELSPEAFGMVVNEVIPPNQGAIIGRLVKDPAQQVEAARVLAKLQPDNARQAEMVVRDMLASGTEDGTQQNLFGEEAFANSVVLERAKIADEAIKQLRRDRSTFRTLVDEAERIQGAGANVLDQTANASRLTTDEKAADLLTQLAFRAGPVSDELSRISRRFKSGELTAAGAAREFLGTIRDAVQAGVDTGADAGGAELGPNGEREGLGPELFQPAPPIDTPAFNNWFGDSKVVDEHGAPLVVYHGTDADFGAFERSDDIGFHFGTRAQANARVTDEGRTIEGANLMPVYLRIEHPYRMPDLNIWEPRVVLSQLEKDGIITAKQADKAGEVDRAFVRKALAAKGYDGIVYKNGVEGKGEPPADSYIALDPTQIKSVNNRGTFDPNDPRILYQSGKPAPWREGEKLGEFDTERGLEGLPQALIPGVKPMTDAERIAAEANKPLKGKAAPPPAGGLFDDDAGAQKTLFQPAYHGTPHIFDKFDSSKIGSGEGAQAYGHGLYFASEKQVAQHYRNALAGRQEVTFDGKKLRDVVGGIGGGVNKAMADGPAIVDSLKLPEKPAPVAADPKFDQYASNPTMRGLALFDAVHRLDAESDLNGKPLDEAVREVAKTYLDQAANAREKADLQIAQFENTSAPEDSRAAAGRNADHWEERMREAALRWQVVMGLKDSGKLATTKPGRLYHVDVPEHHELMDWDKPLSEQPEGIREKLSTLGVKEHPVPPIKDREVASIFNRAMKQIKDATDDGDPIDVLQVRDVIENDSALYHRTLDLMKRKGLKPDDEATPGYWIAEQARDHIQAQLDNQKMTGEGIYKSLVDYLGSDEARAKMSEANLTKSPSVLASEKLREAGIPGHQYVGHESGKTNYVIYDDSRINVTNYEQPKRGSITFAEGKRPLIKLFRDADASTFIHETGHQWLEEMLSDAQHPAASPDLKTDTGTVRAWLGMKEDQAAPTVRQHEKFARGFEQYMREGVAPSSALARVFSQFKSWLTSIYQSIKGLGSPINEDIRSVFDRLLETDPQRTVIGEGREGVQGITDLHEHEAATVEPHEAEPAMDRIVAERDAHIAEQPPEIQDELARASAALAPESGAGAGGPADVVAGSGGPQSQPPGGAGGGERGAQFAGGTQARPESNGLPAGGDEPGSATDTGLRGNGPSAAQPSRPIAPEPATLFGSEQSPFIDKAGNIRVENLTTSADVAQAIHDAADANDDFIGQRRGVVTDGQVLDLADALGMDVAQLNQRKIGQAFNAEQVMAARKLLIRSAAEVSVAAKRAAIGTDEDLISYAEARDRHQMIQGQVAGITAEAGRALRAFRNISGDTGIDQFLRTATGKTLFQLKEEAKLAASLDGPQKISKFMRDAQKRGFGSMILEYWINGLISGPATHTTYMVGNTILALEKIGPETAAAALVGRVRKALGRQGPTVRMGEVGVGLRALASSLPLSAKSAVDALKSGQTVRLPGEDARTLPFQPGAELATQPILDEAVHFSNAIPTMFGIVRGIRDGIVATGALVKAGGVKGAPLVGFKFSPLGAIPNLAVRGVDVVPLGTALRLPSRAVAAIHSFYRASNFSVSKAQIAYRLASEAGLKGPEFNARVADLIQNPTPDMMEEARGSATQLTLMGKGSEFVQALSKLTNTKVFGFPLFKFIDPFVHIAGNILDQSIVQRTPVGLLSPEVRADLMGKNGNIAQDTATARMLVGTGLSIAFGSLAAQGLLSGSGPSDPDKSAMWRLAGNQAHSVRIGDIWYDIHRLGPLGMLASVSADMYDIAHAAGHGDMANAGAALIHAFTQTMLDEGFMSGPSELIQALEDPSRYGAAYVRNQLATFLPYSVALGQVDKATDPYSRQAKGIVDALKAKIPGVSETLAPRRDIWGQPVPNLPALGGNRAFSAIYMQQISQDPVNQALLNLGISPAPVDRSIRGVRLDDAQYDQYAVLAGNMAKQRLDVLVKSSQWSTWPPETQQSIIEETIGQSRETARGIIMARNPQIAAQAVRARLALLQGK